MSQSILSQVAGGLLGMGLGVMGIWGFMEFDWRRTFREPLPMDMRLEVGATALVLIVAAFGFALWAAR